MSVTASKEFNPEKVFVYLFAFTAIEVLWGYAFGVWWPAGRLVLWGGLILFALLKGVLIAMYFMHFKFEGWIIKGLILPTPFLILIILAMIRPDVGANELLDHPIASMYDKQEGRVKVHMNELSHSIEQRSRAHASAPADLHEEHQP